MAVLPGVLFETYVSIDQAPVKIELLEPDRQVQIMIGTPNGGHLILCLSNPAYIAAMARGIADAGIGLAFLLATAEAVADVPAPTHGALLADRAVGCPMNVVLDVSASCRWVAAMRSAGGEA